MISAGVNRYNHPVTTIEGDPFVCTALVPGSMTRPFGYLSFETDQQGLPIPDADGVQPISVVDMRSQPVPSPTVKDIPDRKPRADRPEHHFRLGGAAPSIGICYPESQRFEPITRIANDRLLEAYRTAQPIGESMTLAAAAAIAVDLCKRDNTDINSHQNPRQLANHSSSAAVSAVFVSKLINPNDIQHELDYVVNQDDVWRHLQNPNHPDPGSFMQQWDTGLMQGYAARTRSMIEATVTAMIQPEAEQVVATNVLQGLGQCATCPRPTPHIG